MIRGPRHVISDRGKRGSRKGGIAHASGLSEVSGASLVLVVVMVMVMIVVVVVVMTMIVIMVVIMIMIAYYRGHDRWWFWS